MDFDVCEDLASWARATDGASYRELDPSMHLERPAPLTLESSIDPSFEALLSIDIPPRGLVRIPNATVIGQWGLVRLPDGAFAGELVARTPAGQRSLIESTLAALPPQDKARRRRRGRFYPLLGSGVRNYFHVTHDIMQRTRGLGDVLPSDTTVVVPAPSTGFYDEILGVTDLGHHRRLAMPPNRPLEVDELLVVTPVPKAQISAPQPNRWYRDRVFERFGITDRRPRRRLYVTRREAGHWRVTNEPEVERALAGAGFETVHPHRLGLGEQAALFAQAEAVVGTGAGLTNIVFAPADCTVVQFQDPRQVTHSFYVMASGLEHSYRYVLCRSMPATGPKADASGLGDLEVPVDKLMATLELVPALSADT